MRDLLVLSLVVVTGLRQMGAITSLTGLLAPGLGVLGIDPALVLPALTKYLAGGTAMMGIVDEQVRHHQLPARQLNQAAGFMIHPLDIPGVAVLMSAGRRVARVWKPAALGACVGIALRTVAHILL